MKTKTQKNKKQITAFYFLLHIIIIQILLVYWFIPLQMKKFRSTPHALT
jgi:hypothetical protein